jgi:predicted aspartyl protease
MTHRCLDRRSVGLMALAATLWPVEARADFAAPSLAPRPPVAPQPPADIGMFTDLYRRMTAPVRINGQGPYAFVVDTGANRSVVSAELAARLALTRGPDQSMDDAAGVQSTPTVTAKLAVGGGEPRELVLSVLPAETIGGQGMLGLDRLADQRLTLDFHGRKLRIDGTNDWARDPLDIVVRARRRAGQLTLVDADYDGAAIIAIIDSGSQSTIGNPALQALARAKDPKGLWNAASIVSACGQTISAEIADLSNLRVGGLRIQHLPVAFADLHTFRLWDLNARPAVLLGVDVLSQFDRVQLDFARGEVRFRLPVTA